MFYQCKLCFENLPNIASTSKKPPKLQDFLTIKQLGLHICHHFQFKPFKCKFCDNSFYKGREIVEHYYRIHFKRCPNPSVSLIYFSFFLITAQMNPNNVVEPTIEKFCLKSKPKA